MRYVTDAWIMACVIGCTSRKRPLEAGDDDGGSRQRRTLAEVEQENGCLRRDP